MAYEDDLLIGCAAENNCWQYNIRYDSWDYKESAPFLEEDQTGVGLNKKLYVLDTERSHVLSLGSYTWSSWPMPPNKVGKAHSSIRWKDSIIIFGGIDSYRGVQTFNVTSQTWSVQNSSNVPFDLIWTSCLLLDEDEILLVGADSQDFFYSAAKYYPSSDTWIELEKSELNHWGTRLVKLGSRTFAINGHENQMVEEFHSSNNSWTIIDTKPHHIYYGFHTVLALPATLFAHLPGGCKGIH